jgi:transketolase
MRNDTRAFFATALHKKARENKDIMVVVSDSRGSTATWDFCRELPERFVEVGIAEQNSIGVATGLSLAGKQPFSFGPACFLMMRSQEQVKTDVAYSNTNVKIVGVSAGVSYGVLGSTHHALGDIAAARLMPGLGILVPSDAHQAAKMAEFLADHKGPAYVRLGRGAVEDVYAQGDDCFTFGKANVLLEGDELLICACGEIVHPALQAAKALKEEGINATVLDISSIRPFDEEAVRKYAKNARLVVTAEEHFVVGGLGDAVSSAIWDMGKRVLRLGFADEYTICGTSAVLKKESGLDAEGIAKSIRSNL